MKRRVEQAFSVVEQASQPAGAGDFPVARVWTCPSPNWKVRCTRRLESLRYSWRAEIGAPVAPP
jgi:hypothetical protein